MRITIDIDNPTVLSVTRAWKRLESLDTSGTVMGRISSGGTGCHLKVHGFGGTCEEGRKIRRQIGDDPWRPIYDKVATKKPKQLMFDSKRDIKTDETGEAGPWRDSLSAMITDVQHRDCGEPYDSRHPRPGGKA